MLAVLVGRRLRGGFTTRRPCIVYMRTRRRCTTRHVCRTTKHAVKAAKMSTLLSPAGALRRRRSRRGYAARTRCAMWPYSTKKAMGNPFCMLHCKTVLQRCSRPRIAPIAKAEHVVGFRAEKPHTSDNEGDWLRFNYTLQAIFRKL